MEKGGSLGEGDIGRGRDIGGQTDIWRGIFEKEILKSSIFEKLRAIYDFNKILLSTHKSHTDVPVVNEG